MTDSPVLAMRGQRDRFHAGPDALQQAGQERDQALPALRMVGNLQAPEQVVEVLARAIGAKRVFELGSGYGYSALHFSRAVGEGGTVHYTELSEENVRLAECPSMGEPVTAYAPASPGAEDYRALAAEVIEQEQKEVCGKA